MSLQFKCAAEVKSILDYQIFWKLTRTILLSEYIAILSFGEWWWLLTGEGGVWNKGRIHGVEELRRKLHAFRFTSPIQKAEGF